MKTYKYIILTIKIEETQFSHNVQILFVGFFRHWFLIFL